MPSETKTAAEINREINEALDQRIALNEAVARAMGWEPNELATPDLPCFYYLDGDGNRERRYGPLPDFANDVHALGYMVEWLDAHPCEYALIKMSSEVRCDIYYIAPFITVVAVGGSTPGEALSRAIVAYADAMKEADKKEADHAE